MDLPAVSVTENVVECPEAPPCRCDVQGVACSVAVTVGRNGVDYEPAGLSFLCFRTSVLRSSPSSQSR